MEPQQDGQTTKIRISQIGGRYLLFNIDDIVHIRREHSICAVLVGNTPQAPNQNSFSGLPLELKPDDALLLVGKGAAYIEDDCAAHLSRLRDPAARKAYAEGLKKQKAAIRRIQDEEHEEKMRVSERLRVEKMKTGKGKKKGRKGEGSAEPLQEAVPAEQEETLFESATPVPSSSTIPKGSAPISAASKVSSQPPVYFTPTTSALLLAHPGSSTISHEAPPRPPTAALQAHLNRHGYFITPGLRFGGHFSAYPGDPFRYHAHYMATSYGWDEEIPLLDLVGVGRLATGVKKGYVFGAEAKGNKGDGPGEKDVRAFTLEWAGI